MDGFAARIHSYVRATTGCPLPGVRLRLRAGAIESAARTTHPAHRLGTAIAMPKKAIRASILKNEQMFAIGAGHGFS